MVMGKPGTHHLQDLPRHEMPEMEMPKDVAYRLIKVGHICCKERPGLILV